MNDKADYSLHSGDVQGFVMQILCRLPLVAPGTKYRVADILNVLIFAAAFRTSVNQASSDLQEAPCPSFVLGELRAQLDDIGLLERLINDMLAELLPKKLTRRARQVAIDLIDIPYHGTVEKKHEGEVRRSKAKSGTTHFFVYATAYLVLKGRRYTLAMYRVRADDSMEEVLRKLMGRLRFLHIRTSLVLLDRGFYSVKVIRYLICGRRPFIMPAIKRGKKEDEPGGPTGTRALALLKTSCWRRYTLCSQDDGCISFDVAVVCRNYNGRWNRHERETLLYATWGVRHISLPSIRAKYRRRFGIESSYRQLHQARIKTSTKSPVLRLLFYSIALLLRNVWVWLHSEVIATPRRGSALIKPSSLRFSRMMLWLLFEVAKIYKLLCHIKVHKQLKKAFESFDAILNY